MKLSDSPNTKRIPVCVEAKDGDTEEQMNSDDQNELTDDGIIVTVNGTKTEE